MQSYYATAMPGQPLPTYVQQNGSSQPYAPTAQAFYQDTNGQFVQVTPNGTVTPQQPMMMPGQPYIYMAPPQQGAEQVVQPGQPQLIYYPQAIGQMPPQTAPVYFHPMQTAPTSMIPDQMTVIQQMQPMSQQPPSQPRQMGVEMSTTRTAPLTSSTPLPTSLEYETMQRDNHARNRNIQFRYHRVMEHDELPIAEISEITIDNHNDGTNAEKENLEQRGEKTSRRGFANTENDNQVPTNYKTRLCMMHASGTKPCEMGSRCKFAHGLKELRSSDVPTRYPNNKYKTKLCKNYARGGTGFCPYGLRCEFVHPTDKEFNNIPPYQRMLFDEHMLEQDTPPEDYVVARHQPRFMRSSGRSTTPTKVMLKHRNVAGSMMCLSSAGQEQIGPSGDCVAENNSSDHLPPHLRRARRTNPPATKRRTSLSTKWTSEENLGLHGHY
uniref:C3H1-type domain-containing protein n=1 Tax=Caenorhabditis tropicalis TaxID=1561998 RepID=A0A1I7TK77_9PELO